MSALTELEDAVRGAADGVGPSVVGLGRGFRYASGVVVGDGLVLTNAHNVRGEEGRVRLPDGSQATGRVVGVDVDADVAVIAAPTGAAPAVEWASDTASIGRAVLALANPGGRGLRVTFGLVAGIGRSFRGPRGRRIAGTIEHTAPLVRGSSGGPLVDRDGRLLGINTARLEGGSILALPADAALRELVEALGRGESPARLSLGVAVAPPRVSRRMRRSVGLPERDGLLVRQLDPDGSAAHAGVRAGDLIVAAGGRPAAGIDDLHDALDGLGEGGTLPLTVVRGVDEVEIPVTLGGEAAP